MADVAEGNTECLDNVLFDVCSGLIDKTAIRALPDCTLGFEVACSTPEF